MTNLLPITDVRSCGIARPLVVADVEDGRQFIHLRSFRKDDPLLAPLVRAIDAQGKIDPIHWRLNTGRRF